MSSLAALEARVAALEAELAGGAVGSEAISPNYLNVGSSGLVQAVFPGGVEIPEPTSSQGQWTVPSSGSSVHWTSSGVTVAYVGDIIQLGARRLTLWVDPTTGGASSAQIEARTGPALNQRVRTILDGLGNSSFWQKASSSGTAETSDSFALAGPFSTIFTALAAAGIGTNVVTHNLNWATQIPLFAGASAGVSSFGLGFSNPAAPMNTISITARNNNTVAVTGTVFFYLAGHP